MLRGLAVAAVLAHAGASARGPPALARRAAVLRLDLGALNALVSRFLLPPVLFFQPIVLTLFPSTACQCMRWPYRLNTLIEATFTN